MSACVCVKRYDPATQPGPDGIYETRMIRIADGECPVHGETDRASIPDLWPPDLVDGLFND
jgi:hypothetical protein